MTVESLINVLRRAGIDSKVYILVDGHHRMPYKIYLDSDCDVVIIPDGEQGVETILYLWRDK